MRVAVMGYVGSGKTFLSECISRKKGIPALHLDDIYFDKNWKPVDKTVVLSQAAEFMSEEDWLIDGFYKDILMEERLEKADMIVMLLLPRVVCLYRAIRRSKVRTQQGYKNDLNPWFLKFTLFGCRDKERRRTYREIAQKYRDKTVVLRSGYQVNRFIRSFC